MLGQKFVFDRHEISRYGIVEKAYYPPFSSELLFEDRAKKPPIYKGRKYTNKPVTINFRIIDNTWNPRKIETEVRRIVSLLYSEDPKLLQLNNRYAWAILDDIDYEVYGNTAYMKIIFIVIDGRWMSGVKRINFGEVFSLKGTLPTDEIVVKVKGSKSPILIKYKDKKIEIDNYIENKEVIIDMKNRLVVQDGKYVPVTLDSDYFELDNNELITIESNSDGHVEVREVYL